MIKIAPKANTMQEHVVPAATTKSIRLGGESPSFGPVKS